MRRMMAVLLCAVLLLGMTDGLNARAAGSCSVGIAVQVPAHAEGVNGVRIELYKVGSLTGSDPVQWGMDPGFEDLKFLEVSSSELAESLEAAGAKIQSGSYSPAGSCTLTSEGKATVSGLEQGVYVGVKAGGPEEFYMMPFYVTLLTHVDVEPKAFLYTKSTVTKIWDDDSNRDQIRPKEIKVRLNATVGSNTTVYKDNVTLTGWDDENGQAEYTEERLPVWSGDTEVVYSWEEIAGEGENKYTTAANPDGNNTEITNTYKPETVEISGEKAWEDDGNRDGVRPASITVNLLANGEKVDSVTVTADDDWKYSFTDKPKNDKGTEIKYTVTEEPVDGYETAIEDTKITNTHEIETVDIHGDKIWDDQEDRDGVRPESITVNLLADGEVVDTTTATRDSNWTFSFTGMPKYKDGEEIAYSVTEEPVDHYGEPSISGSVEDGFVIENPHEPETVDIRGDKIWDDMEDVDHIRPEKIYVILLADGEEADRTEATRDNNWTFTFTGMPKFNEDGSEIVYTVTEEQVPGYGDPTIEGSAAEGFRVRNPLGPIDINGQKTWDDANNRDGIRPDSVTVILLANGQQVATATASADNNWSYSFTGLDRFDSNGQPIEYTVTDDVAGYTARMTDGYNLVNTHTSETTSVSVTKTWNDNYDQDGVRPDSVNVTLTANGSAVQTATLSEDNGWTFTWTNLPVIENGNAIEYSVTEDAPEGYTASLSGNAADGFILTNTHEPENVAVSVTKAWNDAGNLDGTRPASVSVQLYANGAAQGEPVTLDDSNDWGYTWRGLPKLSNGAEIEYTVSEVNVPEGYTVTTTRNTGDATVGFILTNTHEPGLGTLIIKKQVGVLVNGVLTTWQPEAIGTFTFRVTGPNGYKQTVSITTDIVGNGSVTLNDLTPGVYIVTEIVPADYKLINENDHRVGVRPASMSEASTTTFRNTIDITKVPPEPVPTTKIEGQKIWDDNDDEVSVRPESITVRLLANGKDTGRTPVWTNRDGNVWSYRFANLPETDENGDVIDYTVEEESVQYYRTTIDGANITNTLVPPTPTGYINLTGNKVWDDNNNAAGLRPNFVTVTLLRNGEAVDQRTVTAANGWQYAFNNIPVDDGYGHTYEYTIQEEAVNGYFTRVDGTTITNSILPPEEPPFGEFTLEELEKLYELFDYDTPLFGGLLGTGDEMPVYPFVFGGVGLAALAVLLVFGRKRRKSATAK